MFDLSTRDIKYLQGVGPQRAAILNKELNIYSFRDLLYYFPYKKVANGVWSGIFPTEQVLSIWYGFRD